MTVSKPAVWAIAGGLVALAAGGLGALAVIETGAFDVAASRPHSLPVFWTTKTAMVRAVRLRARGIAAPARFTPEQAAAGFRLYDAHCVVCHGAPGIEAREAWVDGMTPPPPYLIDAPQLWTRGELYWIVRHGVKMTGMPAWDLTLSEAQTWEVVAFLEALPGMDSQAYARLRAQAARPAASSLSGINPRLP